MNSTYRKKNTNENYIGFEGNYILSNTKSKAMKTHDNVKS